MTRSLVLASLTAGALTVPVPASSATAAAEPVIREITVRPAEPVVGADDSVRLVIDVVVRGAQGKDGVSIEVEPGGTPIRPDPVQPAPERPGPVQSRPDRPAPVRPGPVQPGPVQPGPVQPDPDRPGSVQPGPVQPDPDRPRPVQPRPVQPRPVQPRPVQPGSARPGPVRPGPDRPEPRPAPPVSGGHAPDAPVSGAPASGGQAPAAAGAGAGTVAPGTGVLAPGTGENKPATVLAIEAREPAAPRTGTSAASRIPATRPVPLARSESGARPDTGAGPGAGTRSLSEGVTGLVAGSVPVPFIRSGPAARFAREMGLAVGAGPDAPAPGTAPGPAWEAVPSGMRMAGGWETWRFLPDKQLTRYYPAGTWTITATAKGEDGATVTKQATFQLKRETRMSSVQAENVRGAQGVRLTGSLRRVDPRGYSDYTPFAKQDVAILWRESMSEPWERVATATTGTTGEFARTVPARAGGFWRARYSGTDHYASKVSRLHQST